MTSYEAVVESHINRWITSRRLKKKVRREIDSESEVPPVPPPITFSCAFGSDFQELVARVSRQLGYQLFDREIIIEISKSTKAQVRIIEALDDGNRKEIATLTDQIFSRRVMTDDSYRRVLVRVLHSLSIMGPAIFIGRGACTILKDKGAFNIRLVAPIEDRIQHVAKRDGISIPRAEEMVVEQDEMRRSFIRNHFNRDIDDPTAYHLLLNLSLVRIEDAFDTIIKLYNRHMRGWILESGKETVRVEGEMESQ